MEFNFVLSLMTFVSDSLIIDYRFQTPLSPRLSLIAAMKNKLKSPMMIQVEANHCTLDMDNLGEKYTVGFIIFTFENILMKLFHKKCCEIMQFSRHISHEQHWQSENFHFQSFQATKVKHICAHHNIIILTRIFSPDD